MAHKKASGRASGRARAKRRTTTPSPRPTPLRTPAPAAFPIVGICASAGGLAAFKRFFSTMPAEPGMAFVLIPHLDPTRESLMVELIAKYTRMPVAEARHGTAARSNHVYVIPPDRQLTVERGKLQVSATPPRGGFDATIDRFLTSLANDQQDHAIAIILSGTGSHGTIGLKEIKQAGGLVVVQDPDTAEYDQMPRNAIATGLADSVLPPEGMAEVLVQYTRRAYVSDGGDASAETGNGPDFFNRVLAFLRTRTNYDFRCYRRPMVLRRVRRRMSLIHVDTLDEYVGWLRKHPDEVTALYRDLLIGVTRFFRDPELFDVVAQRVVPEIVEQAGPDSTIRIWVPGCATGEEAYSLAMMLFEHLGPSHQAPAVRVFATDVDERALEVARRGVYPDSVAADLTPDRMRRFFVPSGDHHLRVTKPLRDAVVFASQNLMADAPFSRLDLISCRNVLIYLEPQTQQKLLGLFHFALNPGAFLLLGPSETVGRETGFEPISRKWRVFRRAGSLRRGADVPILPTRGTTGPAVAAGRPQPTTNYAELTRRLLLDEFAPASVLIDRQFQILSVQGPIVEFLEFPAGEPSRDLLAMARPGLRGRIRALVQTVQRTATPATDGPIPVNRAAGRGLCTLAVRPVRGMHDADGLMLLTFHELSAAAGGRRAKARAAAANPREPALVERLEHEVRTTREDLQTSVEAYESANEELKASNEEVMSMNEELQSANEELETSKEELQSLNEELTTVNNQLEEKVDDLARANDIVTNLINSTEIATIFLDEDLHIQRFTPATGRLLRLIETDIGRPLEDLALRVDDAALMADCRTVLQTLAPRETEIWTDDPPDGSRDLAPRCYLRRVLPYRTAESRIAGVVITFVDITARKNATASAGEASFFRALVENLPVGAIYVETSDIVMNAAAEVLTGYDRAELRTLGQWCEALGGSRAAELRQIFESTAGDAAHLMELVPITRKDGQARTLELAGQRFGAHGIWLLIDRTDIDRLAQALQNSETHLRSILDSVADSVVVLDGGDRIISVNHATEVMTSYSTTELVGQPIALVIPSFAEAPRGAPNASPRGTTSFEASARRRDGLTFPVEVTLTSAGAGAGANQTGIIHDIGARKELERRLAEGVTAKSAELARELHDGMGGQLTAIGLLLQSLRTRLERAGSPEAVKAAELMHHIDTAHGQLRATTRGLMPVEDVPEGLMEALGALAAQYQGAASEVRFVCPSPVHVRDQAVATHVFRIAQEAVANAIQHGQARHVTVTLARENDRIRLSVRDDGRGFGPLPAAHQGIGLLNMRQRASLLGAEFRIEKPEAPDSRGTVVSCVLPAGLERA